MSHIEIAAPYNISLAKVIRSSHPREELEDGLVVLLRPQLKKLGISWNPKAFKAGLNNPELPDELLRKFEDFLNVSESLKWALPKTFVEEFDKVIEDIETFNPSFSKELKTSRLSGRIPASTLKKRLGL